MTFEFVAGRPSLDFVATVAARDTVAEEKLLAPGDLARWVVRSGIVDAAPSVTDDGLQRAIRLREALYDLVGAAVEDRLPSRAALAAVNGAAASPTPVPRLARDGLHRDGDLDAVLAVLARDALELTGGADRALVRWCADPTCTRPFLDRSRGRRRRWCGMKGCGDRAKAAAYRRRHRPPDVTPAS